MAGKSSASLKPKTAPMAKAPMWKPGTTWQDVAQANTMKNTWKPGTTWQDVKTQWDVRHPAGQSQPPNSGGQAANPDPYADAVYNKQVTSARGARTSRIRAALGARDDRLGYLGLRSTSGFDAAGGLAPGGQLVFDYSDPVSRASLLQREYMGAREQSDNSIGARGGARSGARIARKRNLDFNEEVARTGLTREATDAIADAIRGIQGADNMLEQDETTALADWAARQAAALRGQ